MNIQLGFYRGTSGTNKYGPETSRQPARKDFTTGPSASTEALKEPKVDGLGGQILALKKLASGQDSRAFTALQKAAAELLDAAAKDGSFDVKTKVALALAGVGPSLCELLIQSLKDNRPFVRATAAEALGKLGDPCAIEPLRAAIENETDGYAWRGIESGFAALGERSGVKGKKAQRCRVCGDVRSVCDYLRKIVGCETNKSSPLIIKRLPCIECGSNQFDEFEDRIGSDLRHCNLCGHDQNRGDWERAIKQKGFVNISGRPQCLACGSKELVDPAHPRFEPTEDELFVDQAVDRLLELMALKGFPWQYDNDHPQFKAVRAIGEDLSARRGVQLMRNAANRADDRAYRTGAPNRAELLTALNWGWNGIRDKTDDVWMA